MCKVSTLRNVESLSVNVLCKIEQLPKISKSCLGKQPLVFIEEEESGLNFSLPQLKERHPPGTVPASAENQTCHECTPLNLARKEDNHDDFPRVRRSSTPFVTANLHQKSSTPIKIIENSVIPVTTSPSDQKKVLKRPKLRVSLSCPGTNDKDADKLNAMHRVPTPPKSPPKNRPATPFLLNRRRSLDSSKICYNLQAVNEGQSETVDSQNSVAATHQSSGKESFFGKKIDRDKLEELDVKEIPGKDMTLAGQNAPYGSKIRMDMTAFKQWIEEHRLP